MNSELQRLKKVKTEKLNIKPGDEVCTVHSKGFLLYGTVGHPIRQLSKDVWYVRFVNDPDSRNCPSEASHSDVSSTITFFLTLKFNEFLFVS